MKVDSLSSVVSSRSNREPSTAVVPNVYLRSGEGAKSVP